MMQQVMTFVVRSRLRFFILSCLMLGLVVSCASSPEETLEPQALEDPSVVYSEALTLGWQNWSWSTTLDFAASVLPRLSGTKSIGVTHTYPWAGFFLHNDTPIDTQRVNRLLFWIHGGQGGQKIRVVLVDAAGTQLEPGLSLTTVANTWKSYNIPLSLLGNPEGVSGIIWQDQSGAATPTYSLDYVVFHKVGIIPPPATIALSIDTSKNRHTISDYVYGINWASETLARDLRLPVRRQGGNATTRYNYKTDTSNRASDFYYLNVPDDNPNSSALPNGNYVDRFVEQDRRTATKSLLTMPMIGWTPKARAIACGFSIRKYGAQQSNGGAYTPAFADCGNGVKIDGTNVTGNTPTDTSLAIGPSWVTGWVQHLVGRYGKASAGGVMFYNLDNEPALWNSTHRDVHPKPVGYDELLSRTIAYAKTIKNVDSSAKTLGPVEWGWSNYFYSALDAASGNWSNPPDRNAHGGLELVAWYLQELRKYEQQNGVRLLDYFDLHYYPQSGVTLNEDVANGLGAKRLRATRSLWDSTYADESWIAQAGPDGGVIRLIPRMRAWVNSYYPGTKLALSEYNFGALTKLNGALTQADVLGIFGRENVDLALLWGMPEGTGNPVPGVFAFKMYRNVDGTGKGFGGASVQATSSDQSKVSVYAAERSDGALTVMVINKTESPRPFTLNLTGKTVTTTNVYRYSATNLNTVIKEADQSVTGSKLQGSVPASSITLFVMR
jgi:Glycoside hydrolase family 44